MSNWKKNTFFLFVSLSLIKFLRVLSALFQLEIIQEIALSRTPFISRDIFFVHIKRFLLPATDGIIPSRSFHVHCSQWNYLSISSRDLSSRRPPVGRGHAWYPRDLNVRHRITVVAEPLSRPTIFLSNNPDLPKLNIGPRRTAVVEDITLRLWGYLMTVIIIVAI